MFTVLRHRSHSGLDWAYLSITPFCLFLHYYSFLSPENFFKKKQNVSISNPVGTWDGGKIKQCLFGAVLRGEAEIKVQRYSLARDDYAQANPSTESCTRCDCPCDRNEDVKIGQREERMFG